MKAQSHISRAAVLLGFTAMFNAMPATAAEICYSAAVPAATYAPPTDSTQFVCPLLGAHTLPELAALGWRVVRLGAVVAGSNITDQLLLRRGDPIHRDGFEQAP